ncbi:E3 ubiquitin-protein ligase MARCHF3-like [Periplaneta americana]|uniref:E3 ubiquitin-protein ligase MARCHF3-like n=1 Tax=Periplaneta americana TaxID=6978 RepID=UPI0037E82EB9
MKKQIIELTYGEKVAAFKKTIATSEDKILDKKTSLLVEIAADEFCRICRDSDSTEHFISPCRCKGTLALIHLSLLERWLAESDTSVCELCRYQSVHNCTDPQVLVLSSPDLLLDAVTMCTVTPLAVIGTHFVLTNVGQTAAEKVPESLLQSSTSIS